MRKAMVSRFARLGVAALGVAVLANCQSSTTAPGGAGGGGGGGGMLGPTQFDTNYSNFNGLVPTTDLPSSGVGSYAGAVKVDSIVPGTTGTAMADVSFDVNFATPGGGAITNGVANNFRGTVDGQDFAYDGELRTGNRYPTALAVTTDQDLGPLPGGVGIPGGIPAFRSGSVVIPMYGRYDTADQESEILLSLTGVFKGAGAQSVGGGAIVQQITNNSVAEQAGTGDWYAHRN